MRTRFAVGLVPDCPASFGRLVGEHAQCGHRTGFHQRAAAFLFQQHGGQAADECAAAEGVQRVAVFAGQCAVAAFLYGIQNLIKADY